MAAALTATATATEATASCAQWGKAWPCLDKLNAMLDYEIGAQEVLLCCEGEVHTQIHIYSAYFKEP